MKAYLSPERKISQIQSIKITNLKEDKQFHTHREKSTLNINLENQIDDLNLKFYLETEKYLNNKANDAQCQSRLFSILFKQINIYSREINRLNKIITESKDNDDHLLVKDSIIKSLRESEIRLGKCLSERIESENRLRIENSQLKKENEEYKKKLNELKENRLMSEITKAESNDIEIINKEILSKSTYSNENQKKKNKTNMIISGLDDYYSKRMQSISRNNKAIKLRCNRKNKTVIKK